MRTSYRVIVVFAAALLAATVCMAESKIVGRILDQDGQPLKGASVTLEPVEPGIPVKNAKTRKKGNFFFVMVRQGTYRILVEAEGFRVATVDIEALDEEGKVSFQMDGPVRQGSKMPEFQVGAGNVTYDMTVAPSTGGGGEFGTGIAVLGSEQIIGLIQSGKLQKARDEIDRGLADTPDDPRLHYVRAYLEMQDGNPEAALEAVDRAIAADDSFPGVHLLRGVLLQDTGDLEGAGMEFRREIETAGDKNLLRDSYIRLSQLARSQEKWDEAEEALEKLLEVDPSQASVASFQLLELYLRKDDMEAVRALLENAPEEMLNDPAVHFNIGAEYWNQGKGEEAAAAFARAVELDPNLPEAHRQLGFAEANIGHNARAVEELSKYLELSPDASDAAVIRNYIDKLESQQ